MMKTNEVSFVKTNEVSFAKTNEVSFAKTNEVSFAKTSKVKNKLSSSLLLAVLAAPGAALAADATASPHMFSANVGLATDYIFRGISQTSHNPALQGGIDYMHASGLYAGVWGSNVSWIADSGAVATGSVTLELDTYLGFRNGIAEDFS